MPLHKEQNHYHSKPEGIEGFRGHSSANTEGNVSSHQCHVSLIKIKAEQTCPTNERSTRLSQVSLASQTTSDKGGCTGKLLTPRQTFCVVALGTFSPQSRQTTSGRRKHLPLPHPGSAALTFSTFSTVNSRLCWGAGSPLRSMVPAR